MIRAIIFDLDNRLSAADEVGRGLLEPVSDAIRRANKGALLAEALGRAFELTRLTKPTGEERRDSSGRF
jgi:putative hydrolase of the HAD superfamily